MVRYKGYNMNRTDVINFLIWYYKYETYLEIGVRNPNHNFNQITAKKKFGVDPSWVRNHNGVQVWRKTSDQLFSYLPAHFEFDIVFIDGDHHVDQVLRDIYNAWRHLTLNGTIVIHDCNPASAFLQREKKQGCGDWNGTVWKAFIKYRFHHKDAQMFTVDCDHGVGIIRKGGRKKVYFQLQYPDKMDYKWLEENRVVALHLISADVGVISDELDPDCTYRIGD